MQLCNLDRGCVGESRGLRFGGVDMCLERGTAEVGPGRPAAKTPDRAFQSCSKYTGRCELFYLKLSLCSTWRATLVT